ncbi:hypothetical protein TREMEDRAFT_58968 [Tremella mesenterica DSM 1558]|uniref:uncharacterized protein n=1 Tax=Tremella mesenterica (strain ATCC 24925 / CBS 8224 / DSM 1558 / NBRC 9311 / NRRL Y-6157 / RJB 2259-6 / UBC 559-6) TaxID=578456 RepID=UPI0003F4A22B|nr:uncharacterized protein TREMEDRAFT_58968 [Tremella mesenterica DSM 1558]EIW72798.1 hypothetical protein TREMEDRAFT_58968 [Tremella mesenterica DSM 1558]
MSDPTTGAAPAVETTANPTSATATGQQDALDKGVSAALGKAGHGQSASTTEKISDGLRGAFKKVSHSNFLLANLPVTDDNIPCLCTVRSVVSEECEIRDCSWEQGVKS